MKAWIWVGCILVLACSMLIIKNCGIILGGIPTALMVGGVFWLAESASAKCDKKGDRTADGEEESRDEEGQ